MFNIPSNINPRVAGLSYKTFIEILPDFIDAPSSYTFKRFNNMQKRMSLLFFLTSITSMINNKSTLLSIYTWRFPQLFTSQVAKSCFSKDRNFDESSCSPSWVEYPLKANICVVQFVTVNFKTQNSLRSKSSQTGWLVASRRIPYAVGGLMWFWTDRQQVMVTGKATQIL